MPECTLVYLSTPILDFDIVFCIFILTIGFCGSCFISIITAWHCYDCTDGFVPCDSSCPKHAVRMPVARLSVTTGVVLPEAWRSYRMWNTDQQ